MHGKRRNQLIYTILLAVCIAGFWWFENFYTPAAYSKVPSGNRTPAFPEFAIPRSADMVRVDHRFYSLSYREAYEQAEWVAYTLLARHLTHDDRERPWFIEDPQIDSKSADWRNYRGSGYDRGHLCPAGDRRFTEQAYNETFYTSNISPQRSDFNAGLWNRLEMQVRAWARRYGELQVITGGVLTENLPTIGEEDVAVPGAFYKIVFKGGTERPQVIAFLVPHEESSEPLANFLVTVDSLERLTQIDFFPGLPETIENELEGTMEPRNWKF